MFENEKLTLDFLNAPKESRAVLITGSGAASMEAVVMGLLDARDKAIVVNGGSFGARFCRMRGLHKVPFESIGLPLGKALSEKDLVPYDGAEGYSAIIVNIDETSTGVLYDLPLVSAFYERNGLLLIVDVISSFLADPLDVGLCGVDVVAPAPA